MTDCKQCTKCLVAKPLNEYYRNRGICRKCYNITQKLKYNSSLPAVTKKRQRFNTYYSNNKEKLKAYHREHTKKYRVALRLEIITTLGGKCECCGELNIEFLTLEHKFNDGARHSRALVPTGVKPARSDAIYLDVKRQGFPKDKYGILCWNCNSSKGAYGYCPHQKQQVEVP